MTGIEPDISRARIGKEKHGLTIYDTTIENLDINETFDVITFVHCLEHFHDPKEAIRRIIPLMKDNGYIYIEVPDLLNSPKGWHDSTHLAHMVNFCEHNLMLLGLNLGLTPIMRTFPKTESFGVVNLGIVFKVDRNGLINRKVRNIKNNVDDLFQKTVLFYKHGIPKYINSIPIKIVVSEINDISLTFKPSGRVHSSLIRNIEERIVIYSKRENKLIVSSPNGGKLLCLYFRFIIRTIYNSINWLRKKQVDSEFIQMVYKEITL